jgi:hypothetical protein
LSLQSFGFDQEIELEKPKEERTTEEEIVYEIVKKGKSKSCQIKEDLKRSHEVNVDELDYSDDDENVKKKGKKSSKDNEGMERSDEDAADGSHCEGDTDLLILVITVGIGVAGLCGDFTLSGGFCREMGYEFVAHFCGHSRESEEILGGESGEVLE